MLGAVKQTLSVKNPSCFFIVCRFSVSKSASLPKFPLHQQTFSSFTKSNPFKLGNGICKGPVSKSKSSSICPTKAWRQQMQQFLQTRGMKQQPSLKPRPRKSEVKSKENEFAVKEDTLIFAFYYDKLYNLMTAFGLCLVFYSPYLAYIVNNLVDVPDPGNDASFITKLNAKLQGSSKLFAGLILFLGWAGSVICFVYPTRTIRRLILLKGGQTVRVETYRGWYRYKVMYIPVEDISALSHRTQFKSNTLLRIRGHSMNYLCDNEGRFVNTYLFDHHVGLHRF